MNTTRTTRRVAAGVATAAVSALVLAGCTGGGGGSDVDEIVVGLVFPTTGQMSVLGTDQGNAVKVVIDWANENGGIDGVPIRVVEADSQSDPGVASTAAQRLIDQEEVDILIGSYSSGLSQAMLPVAQRSDVILWEVGSVSTTINADGNSNFFRTIGNAATYAGQAVDFLENYIAPELGVPVEEVRVAIINEDGSFGSSVRAVYDELAAEKNLNVVYEGSYPITTPDFSPLLINLKEAQPDVLLTVPSVADAQLFWDQAAVQGFDVGAVIGSSGFTAASFPDRFGAEGVEGVFGVEPPALANMSLDGLTEDLRPLVEEWMATFEETYGHQCLVHCGDGIGGAYILVEDVLPRALEESGSVDSEAIIAAAAQTDLGEGETPQGFGVKFDTETGSTSTGDNTLGFASIMQWQNGELTVVWPEQIAASDPYFPMPTFGER